MTFLANPGRVYKSCYPRSICSGLNFLHFLHHIHLPFCHHHHHIEKGRAYVTRYSSARIVLVWIFKHTPSVGPGDSDLYSKLRSAFTRITTIGFGAEGKLYAQPVQEVQGPEIKTCWSKGSEMLLVSKLNCSYTHWRVYFAWRHALRCGRDVARHPGDLGSIPDVCPIWRFLLDNLICFSWNGINFMV